MYTSGLGWDTDDEHYAVCCSNGGICTSSCISQCQTNMPMRPEEMVKYGWDIEIAKEKQATALAVYYKLKLI